MPAAFTNCVLVSISRRTNLAPHQRFELLRGQWHRIGPMWKRMGRGD
jgi:hypothetical protein